MPEVLTPETLAERWQCTPRHVRDLCKEGKLRHFRVGILFRIRREAVNAYEMPPIAAENKDLPMEIDSPPVVKKVRTARLDIGPRRARR